MNCIFEVRMHPTDDKIGFHEVAYLDQHENAIIRLPNDFTRYEVEVKVKPIGKRLASNPE